MTHRLLPLAACALLASCATTAPAGAPCGGVTGSGWNAWVNAMPGPAPPTLIVTGRVTVPTGGHSVRLEFSRTREIDPPVQEVDVIVEPPRGPATQALVTHEVRASTRALPRYGAVIIRCGGAIMAEISPVDIAH